MDCPTFNSSGEDNRLNNWKKWIELRREFHQQIYKIQHRTPSELALNAGEDYRLIKEIQLLHEHAKIPEVFSNRGKPSFWYLPTASRKFPSLISVMPKPLDFEVPERITVGVPTLIQREKNILTGKERKHSNWFNNTYLKKQNKLLESKIKRIQPHTVSTENLIIKGIPYQSEVDTKVKSIHSLHITDKDISESSSETTSSEDNLEDVPVKSLQIEDATFTADGNQEIKKYLVFIDYEIGKRNLVNRSIFLTNIGNVSLRYYWHRHLPKRVLQDLIPHRLPMYGFIFTKNESLILPDNTNEIEISFITNKPGMYKEIWELRTEPNVFDGKILKGEFFLVLHASAETANFAESEKAILSRIEEGMKYTTVENIILDILQRMQTRTATRKETGHKITEKDLFEAVNAKFGPSGTLPLIYHYNKEIVQSLKHMYDKLKTETDPPEWNYKIEDIDNLIHKCDMEEQIYFNSEFNKLVNKIFTTNMIVNEDREKYENIYDLLCVMIDQMSTRIYDLRYKYKIPLIEIYPAVTEKILMEQEYLDDNCRNQLYFPDITAEMAAKRIKECKVNEFERPAMELMESIPFEDFEQRYKVYQKEKYGIDVDAIKVTGKKGKGKGKKGDKPKKAGKKGKEEKGKKKEKEVKKKIYVRKESVMQVESFTKLLTDKVEIIPEYIGEGNESPSENSFRMYHYNLYITIYLLLCKTVNEIEILLEHMKSSKRISRKVLRKCIELGIPTMPIPDEVNKTRREYKAMYHDIENFSAASISDSSFTVSNKTVVSDICRSYADYEYDFFKPIFNTTNIIHEEVVLVDAQTETDAEELFPPKSRVMNIQTEEDREEFDLVAKIEKELSATSVQYIRKPMKDEATQVEICNECILEDIAMMEEG